MYLYVYSASREQAPFIRPHKPIQTSILPAGHP